MDKHQKAELVFASFNQDTTSLAVGTSSKYKLYSLNSADTLEAVYENFTEGVYIAERLFSSSLVAVVSKADPRKLRVCHFKKGTEICNYSYFSKILAVKMNRARLVVCLEESLFIHNIRDMKVMHTIKETPPNKKGLCALSTDSDRCYLAYPGHSTVGELQIFDALNLASTSMIPAHTGQLGAIQFSPSGTRIATASDKGTVIRVFNVADGSKLYELRRGLKRTATIHSLSFSPCGSFLASSSNTETVHIFRLEESSSSGEAQGMCQVGSGGSSSSGSAGTGGTSSGADGGSGSSWMGYLSNVVSVSATYLPTQVTDTLLQGRAFATVHHNLYGYHNICALAVIKKTLRVLLVSDVGYLYMYSLDINEGGDCHLIRQFHLAGGSDDKARDEDDPVAAATAGSQRLEKTSLSADQTDAGSIDSPRSQQHPEVEISYADRLKKRHPASMTDSEKFHEMALAAETPPKQCFLLDDDGEFPPIKGGATAISPSSGKPKKSGNSSDSSET